jgi:hypothetical protein
VRPLQRVRVLYPPISLRPQLRGISKSAGVHVSIRVLFFPIFAAYAAERGKCCSAPPVQVPYRIALQIFGAAIFGEIYI